MSDKNEKSVWMHIGAGSFHRAHQAIYVQKLIDIGEKWSISLGNIRNDTEEMLKQLDRQQQRYVLETVTPRGERSYQVVTSITKVLPYCPDCKYLISEGSLPETKVISFTVTESGYYHDVRLDLKYENPDVKADMEGGTHTIYGVIIAILKERFKSKLPLTLLSCDNVRHNGAMFKRCLMEFLEKTATKELLEWAEKNISCPNTMVDRITPHPSAELVERVNQQNLGFEDKIPVMAESFMQWVVEDNFCDGRPPLEKVGVQIVESVTPYEDAKIRILNSSHALCAWAGTLVGHQYIHEDVNDKDIHKMAHDYVTLDVITTLKDCPIDLAKYRDVILDRFSNPYIADTNHRVSGDGWTKLPSFFVPTISQCFERGHTPRSTLRIVAIYFNFLQRWHNDQLPFAYHDGCMIPEDAHKIFQSKDPLDTFSHEKRLFGKLTDLPDFIQVLKEEVEIVNKWLDIRKCGQPSQ